MFSRRVSCILLVLRQCSISPLYSTSRLTIARNAPCLCVSVLNVLNFICTPTSSLDSSRTSFDFVLCTFFCVFEKDFFCYFRCCAQSFLFTRSYNKVFGSSLGGKRIGFSVDIQYYGPFWSVFVSHMAPYIRESCFGTI